MSPDGRSPRAGGEVVLGRLEPAQLKTWYARAGVFAHPARYEPFGLAPLEAALSGCALVLGDIPSLREIWDDAAVFVPPEDVVRLRLALIDLIEDRPRREELARRAGARARRYTPERMAAGYLDLYADVRREARP